MPGIRDNLQRASTQGQTALGTQGVWRSRVPIQIQMSTLTCMRTLKQVGSLGTVVFHTSHHLCPPAPASPHCPCTLTLTNALGSRPASLLASSALGR